MNRVIGALNISKSKMSVSGQASAVVIEVAASPHPSFGPEACCGTFMMIVSRGLGNPVGGTDALASGATRVTAEEAIDVVIGQF